jgi:hypothetical protein
MIQIRRDQMDAFQRKLDERLVRELSSILRSDRPDLTAGLAEDTLRHRVSRGVDRGRSHGLTEEGSLLAFVTMMLQFGPRFDEHPRIARVLSEARPAPDALMAVLTLLVPDRVWEELAILARGYGWSDPETVRPRHVPDSAAGGADVR